MYVKTSKITRFSLLSRLDNNPIPEKLIIKAIRRVLSIVNPEIVNKIKKIGIFHHFGVEKYPFCNDL